MTSSRPLPAYRFEESEVKAGLFLARALAQEVHAQNRLAGAGRPEDQSGGAFGHPASDHLVQVPNAERAAPAARCREFAGRGEHRLHASVDSHPVASDLEEMGSAKMVASAKLLDDQLPHGAHAVHHVVDLEQAVDHGSRGVGVALSQGVGEQDGRAAEQRENDVQLVDEDLELFGGGRDTLRADDAVDHQKRGAVSLDHLPDESEEALQPFAAKRLVAADVMDGFSHHLGVEKRHVGNVGQHPPVRFGQQRDVQSRSAGGGMSEARLVPEDRLARSGSSRDDVAPSLQEAATQDQVELSHPGGHARNRLWTLLLSLHALAPPNLLRLCSPSAAAPQ